MFKKIALHVFLMAFCLACNLPKPKNKSHDITEATSVAFNSMIVADSTFKNNLRERMPSGRSLSEMKNSKNKDDIQSVQRLEALEKEIDTVKISVVVEDTLVLIRNHYLESKLLNRPNNPSSFYTGLDRWASEIRIANNSRLFNMHNLSIRHGYRCYLNSSLKKPIDEPFYAGIIRMSPIYFNNMFTKAFVYTEITCGNLCGASYDIFLEKRNNKWVIVKKIMGWVS